MDPYAHRFALPPVLSKSGQKPTLKMRLTFLMLGLFFSFALANAAVACLVEGTMYPGVSIGGHPVAWKTRAQAANLVRSAQQNFALTIVVGNKEFHTTTQDLGAEYDADKTVDIAYQSGRSALPLLGLLRVLKGAPTSYVYQIDTNKLSHFTHSLSEQVGTPPTNATIQVSAGAISVVSDKDGSSIDVHTLERIISDDLNNGAGTTIHIPTQTVQADIVASETTTARDQAADLLSRSVMLQYQGKSFVASPTNIGYWLTFEPDGAHHDPKLVVTIDKTQVKGWVQSVANQINIAPKNKKVTIRNGATTVDQEGVDGLAVKQSDAVDAITAAMEHNQDINFSLTALPVPFKTETNRTISLDYGRYIEVNLSKQHLWVYQDNQVIYSSPVTSGATGAGFPTVTGLFAIYAKATNTYLNGRPYGYNYNVFVRYWMPFYAGYGLHDASWRSSFGGPDYWYGGSHGCVNLPDATAQFLYSWADVGTPVWVHK